MDYVPTTWPIFVAIIAIYVVISLYMLGAKKLFFEPYDESKAEPGSSSTATTSNSEHS